MKTLLKTLGSFWRRSPLPPRVFPHSGYKVIDPSTLIEEERLPHYDKHIFYPVRIGDIFQNQYQVVSKLGFGSNSTVWFCHDLV